MRQRAFIEIWSTQEVWRAQKCERVGRNLEQLLRIFHALQTSRVLHISMNAQLTYEPVVL